MSNISSAADLFDQAYQHYQKGDYEKALHILTEGLESFPGWGRRIHFWRMCMAGKMGQIPLVFEIFEEALQAGYWFSETQLRDDADLDPLQGHPAFERLISICRERQKKAREGTEPQRKIIVPETFDRDLTSPLPLLIALHGNNSNMERCYQYWKPAVPDGWLLVLPQSSQVMGPEAYVWNDWKVAQDEIEDHIAAVQERYPLDQDKQIIAGISMGARIAMRMALTSAMRLKSFLAISPFLPPDDTWDWDALAQAGGRKQVRGYFILGAEDQANLAGAEPLTASLDKGEIPWEMETHPGMGHSYPNACNKSLENAVQFLVNK